MQTPLGLVRMCTLPQRGTNSVAHMVNAMNRVLRDCIPDITMPFLNDIPVKGCLEDTKDELIGTDGCRRFITDHIFDCEKILQRPYLRPELLFWFLDIMYIQVKSVLRGRSHSCTNKRHDGPLFLTTSHLKAMYREKKRKEKKKVS